jgi:hypothetical protein
LELPISEVFTTKAMTFPSIATLEWPGEPQTLGPGQRMLPCNNVGAAMEAVGSTARMEPTVPPV